MGRSAARLRAVGLAGFVAVAGCAFPLRFELATPQDTLRWQNEITNTVNNHDERLNALEAKEVKPHADQTTR